MSGNEGPGYCGQKLRFHYGEWEFTSTRELESYVIILGWDHEAPLDFCVQFQMLCLVAAFCSALAVD